MSQEMPGQTLQATALVHEAYLRLVGSEQQQSWENRGHFFAAAAEAMRRILVDNARRKNSLKHGGDRQRVGLDELHLAIDVPDSDLLLLNEALQKLERKDKLKADLVKLCFFPGSAISRPPTLSGFPLQLPTTTGLTPDAGSAWKSRTTMRSAGNQNFRKIRKFCWVVRVRITH